MTPTGTAIAGDGIDGAVAFVTGAAGGIGRAVAGALAARGAVVVATDHDAVAVQALATELVDRGATTHALPLDVRDPVAVEEAVAWTEAEVGPVDILASVAGVLQHGPAVEIEPEQWRQVFAVNVDGVFHASRAVARRMVPRGRGRVVTVASNAAGVPRAGMAAYAASKAAAAAFTHCLGLEVAPHGVRCNVVCPGSTDTPMLRSLWTDEHGRETTLDGDPGQYRVGIPLRRIASPGDVAEVVLFLASEAARHVTMQDVYVDGGAALHS